MMNPILLILAVGANALVVPHIFGQHNDGGLKDLQPTRAKNMMMSWVDKLDHTCCVNVDQTEIDSYCIYTCLEGIRLIDKEDVLVRPFSTLETFSYDHIYRTDPVTSHIILCISDPVQSSMNVVGIVENPDNRLYNKRIVPVMENLIAAARETEYSVNINPLSKWSGGEFYWALKNTCK